MIVIKTKKIYVFGTSVFSITTLPATFAGEVIPIIATSSYILSELSLSFLMQQYKRQIILEGWSAEAQEKICTSKVLIIGAGALGSHAAMALCAAGVGHFVIFDGDKVEAHNLHRQFHYTQADCGKNKAEVLGEKLKALHPDVHLTIYASYWNAQFALPERPHIIIDGSDLFSVKYEIQSFAHQTALPWIYASVLGYKGEIAVFIPGQACYTCLYPTQPALTESCEMTGVVPMLPALIAQKQAWEALKVLGAPGKIMTNSLWHLDLLQGGEKIYQLEKSSECTGNCIVHTLRNIIPVASEISAEHLMQALENKDAGWYFYDIRPESAYGKAYPGMEYLDPSDCRNVLSALKPGSRVVIACSKGKNSKQLVKILGQNHPEFKLYSLEKGLENMPTVI